ncbi:fructosamine kinase family protein [Alkalimarinus coralli]|uniref:fructosamine kinase family protein n=1 Tax=Alkalimarinus coralli TaxID=2935863 RepID=UPI00202B58F1|nr:fructosamine kinase family protein [Alkalimarinus coralli]
MPIFTKHGSASTPGALIAEAKGLDQLRQALNQCGNHYLRVPNVFKVTETTLETSEIRVQSASQAQMVQLGKGLAQLHHIKQPHYGLNEDNFIGLNPQANKISQNWGDFFVTNRLQYQVSLIKQHSVRGEFDKILSSLQHKLIDFLNLHCEHASLVHGDLWSGNVLFDQDSVWLIDPAIYYADREVDLAMTEMFGGFSRAFYQSYDSEYPRTAAYQQKKVFYNLYHFLNHYNLFGNSYLPACEAGFNALGSL